MAMGNFTKSNFSTKQKKILDKSWWCEFLHTGTHCCDMICILEVVGGDGAKPPLEVEGRKSIVEQIIENRIEGCRVSKF